MTLAEVGEIFAYWSENPPVHLMVQGIARMLGWKPAERGSPSITDIAARAPMGLSVVDKDELGLPAPMLDVEAMRARNIALLAKSQDQL